MQRLDESSNRRQWTRPVLTQLRVSGRTDSGGQPPRPSIYEGVCLPTSQNTLMGAINYRVPTSGDAVDGSSPECYRM